MKNAITSMLAGATLLGASAFAFAGEGQGVIASVDMDTRTIILEDGSTWVAADGIVLDDLAPGDTIAVVYDDGTTTLTEVTKVE